MISIFGFPRSFAPAQDDKLRLSFDRGQLLQVNALDPLLQFAGVLVLQFYLDEITIGDHHPQSSVLGVFFECFETGIAIDVHRFGITFARVAVALQRLGRSAHIIRV